MRNYDIIRMAKESKVLATVELAEFAKKVAAYEREACAKIADEWAVGWPHPSTVIAEEIRSRGNQ
jgi:hypothetical protein